MPGLTECLSLILRSIFMNSGVAPLIPMVDQLREGLELHGIMDIIKADRANWQPIFTPSDTFAIDADSFLDNVLPLYSDVGSNKHEKEIDTYKAFSDCVQSMAISLIVFIPLSFSRICLAIVRCRSDTNTAT